jgi:Proline utilization A N-terminal domain
MQPTIASKDGVASAQPHLESSIREYGGRILALMDAAEPPSVFSKKGFYGSLMEWAMRDEHFKTQLFRFVDVLPALNSAIHPIDPGPGCSAEIEAAPSFSAGREESAGGEIDGVRAADNTSIGVFDEGLIGGQGVG